ncbi:MAG: SLOG family protein [Clostridia bacterium]|nr:SLOG family protein [Clostridia bacterium]
MSVCAFTGHRNLTNTDFDELLLERVVENLVKTGTKRFLCGMAVGFDMKAAQAVISLKEKYEIELVACLPCANQSERFSAKSKQLYEQLLSKCDEVSVLEPVYVSGCMHKRDRYLVDNSDILVSFLRKSSGGTHYTVNYAKKKDKKIIEL